MIVHYPSASFEGVRDGYVQHLEHTGWERVAGSETNQAQVAALLREIGQHDAAALSERTPTYGVSYRAGATAFALNVTAEAGARVQLSRIG